MRFIISWITSILFNAIGLFAVAQLFTSFYLADFGKALLASVIIFILNVFVRQILVIFSFPETFFTLGLFFFVIYAIMLLISQYVYISDFFINYFVVAIIASIIISIINAILSSLVSNK